MTRFLSREEIARLHGVLDAEDGKGNREHADIIRLLLLTGCRKNEILRLRWSEVGDDMLELEDSKTGPRKVPLNAQARRILARQPRGEGAFVFPSPRHPDRPLQRQSRSSGSGSEVRGRVSRTCGFTTSAIRTPATRR